MNVGRELISKALSNGDITPLLNAGFTYGWVKGMNNGSEVIFVDVDRQAYLWMLSHWNRHHTTPSIDIFREHFPKEVYPIADNKSSVEELIDLATEKVNSFLLSEIIGKTIDLHDAGDIPRAVALLQAESARIGSTLRIKQDRADSLNDPDFDLEELLAKEIEPGIPMGIYPVDDSFYGFQQGQLITMLGRQKAGKTTFMLNSALQAWEDGYDVLFFSVEMDVELLRQRLYSLGAHVSPARFRRGRLMPAEKNKVRQFNTRMSGDNEVSFYISKKKSMITVDDIISETRLYHPHVVYIDGFNFMLDRNTKRMTEDWQANEAVAAELKTLALEEGIVVVVSTQVQEKQYHAKHGIEARTIMGGTGLLKASDLVVGLDKENYYHTISCVLSRFEYFDPTVVEIEWDNMTMNVLEGVQIGEGEI